MGTITKVNEERVASDMDFTDFTFTDNISQPVHNEGASAPPLERTNRPPYVMGPDELNFRTEFGEMAYDLALEMERLRLDRGNPVPERTAPVSPQGPNPFVVPVVQLYKANSEGQRAQFEILPEEFNPKITRLAYPYLGAFGMEDLDLEATGEMILKVTLTSTISKNPGIETDRLINYLDEFTYRSRAINQEFLNRVRYKKTIFPGEAQITLENFLLATNNFPNFNYRKHSYIMDEFLLGTSNWRNASENSIRPEVRRYLMWGMNLSPNQRYLGWTEADWNLLSTKDMCLFYRCFFYYPEAFAMVFIILLKQLSPEKLEAKLKGGGLSNIPPLAFMNSLRIALIRIKDYVWRKGNLNECIPAVNHQEWPQIYSHCTNIEFHNFVKLRDNPRAVMANQATGRQTPVKEYCEIINQSFRETLDRNGNGQITIPVSVQSQSAFVPTRRSGYYGIVDTPATNRRSVAQPTNGGLIDNASNRVRPNNRSVTQPRLFTQPTSSSITTSTSNVVNTSSRGQGSVNTVPAHQSNQIISQSLVYPPNMDISSEFRNLNLTTSQHNQSTPLMTAETGNQNSSQDREPSHHNSQSRGESNIMSSTMIVPPNGNSGDSEGDSDDPDVGNVFENSEGQVPYP